MSERDEEIRERAYDRRSDVRLRRWVRQELHRQLQAAVAQIIEALKSPTPVPHPASGLRIYIGAHNMADPITLNVDVQGETVSAQFVDDKGDLTTDVPEGATIAYSSSDDSVVSVDASSGVLTFNAAGSATLTATAGDASGTPIASIAAGTADLVLTPGAAASLLVSVQGAPPVPAP